MEGDKASSKVKKEQEAISEERVERERERETFEDPELQQSLLSWSAGELPI